MAEADVAELGDGPAEAVVVDGSRPDDRLDIVRGRGGRSGPRRGRRRGARRVRFQVTYVTPIDAETEILRLARAQKPS